MPTGAGASFISRSAIICWTHPCVTTVSLLSNTTYSPRTRLSASLQASLMPRSVCVRTISMWALQAALTPARYSEVPSSEPMSMNINSKGGRAYLSTLGTHNLVYSSMPTHGIRIDTKGSITSMDLLGVVKNGYTVAMTGSLWCWSAMKRHYL